MDHAPVTHAVADFVGPVAGGALLASAFGGLLADPAVHAMLTPVLGALGGFVAAVIQYLTRRLLAARARPPRLPTLPPRPARPSRPPEAPR